YVLVSPRVCQSCVVWILRASRLYLGCLYFQAEDCIRDQLVTGVQTCALPISLPCALAILEQGSGSSFDPDVLAALARVVRSEERRVGEEWRSRWAPDHLKKKKKKKMVVCGGAWDEERGEWRRAERGRG